MAETTVEDLRAELRQALDKVNTRRLGDASIASAVAVKDVVTRANAALARARPSPASLRALIGEVRLFH
jgi:hypothetical protein